MALMSSWARFVLSHLLRDRGTGGMEGLIVNLGGARSTLLGHHTRQEAGRPPKMPLLDKYTTVAAGVPGFLEYVNNH